MDHQKSRNALLAIYLILVGNAWLLLHRSKMSLIQIFAADALARKAVFTALLTAPKSPRHAMQKFLVSWYDCRERAAQLHAIAFDEIIGTKAHTTFHRFQFA